MKNLWNKATAVAVLILLLCDTVHGQVNGNALLVRKTKDFEITGTGTAAEWLTTEWVELKKRKGSADYHTRAKLLYSDSGIYGLFFNEDEKITATFQEDFADLWREDVIEIFLWPDESTSIYFEYELSPLNKELAILVPNFDGHFLGWRPWRYEGGRKTRHATHEIRGRNGAPQGWIAEFFIPYALLEPLRYLPPTSGNKWRMNMYRIDYDYEPTAWSWKPVNTNFHDYKSFGVILFE